MVSKGALFICLTLLGDMEVSSINQYQAIIANVNNEPTFKVDL
jgi:hypothetical protein